MKTDLPAVAVLMSTYNGERFIREQVDSILEQQGVAVKLYIRDDGSKDATCDIVRDYAAQHGNVIFWNEGKVENYGVKKSFLSLMKDVLADAPDMRFFAFADQDDYWLPDKLSSAVERLAAADGHNKPAMYYSNKTFVDQDLNDPRQENIMYYGDFYEGFYGSLVSGCTMVFNRPLAELSTKHMPEAGFLHDSWVYRLAKCVGADIVFDRQSYILYRQHGTNVVGEEGCKPAQYRWGNVFRKREHPVQNFYREIDRYMGEYIGKEERKYVDWMLTYNRSIHSKIKLAFDPQARRRGLKSQILWMAKLIFGTL